jgi:CheY-like chemotaxis protein
MPSQLVCRPEQDLPVAVLRVAGVLDAVTGPALCRAVRRCLSTQPDAVVIDVSALRIDASHTLDELTSVARQNAEWPAVPIVLCAAQGDTADRLRHAPTHPTLVMADSCAEALARAGTGPQPRRVRVRLRPAPGACRQVRTIVTRSFAAWHFGNLAATAALIATELVANVVRHAHTSMEFSMALRNGRISLAVRDGSTRLPQPAEPGTSQAGGRGLCLVRDLTEAWGVLPLSDGKVVWTTLHGAASA